MGFLGLRRWSIVTAAVTIGLLGATLWPQPASSTSGEYAEPIDAVERVVSVTDQPATDGDRPVAGPAPRTVAVVGDSITYLSTAAIHSSFDGSYEVEVSGVPGIKVSGQQSSAHTLAGARPDVAVVNLGTNDLLAGRSPEAVIDDLRTLHAEFGPTTCLVVVTLTTTVTDQRFKAGAFVVNDWIRSHTHVADWDAVLASSPNRELTNDTIHPTTEGQALIATLLLEQVSACAAENRVEIT